MSYIIAFVSYSNFNNNEYPVQCFRTDLVRNDEVIIRRADGKLRTAKVLRLEYLNWDCQSFIQCKRSECYFDSVGNLCLPSRSALIVGIATAENFIKKLQDCGWIPLKSHRNTYRKIFAKTNDSQLAYISIRKNGVDIQLLPITEAKLPIKPYSLYDSSFSLGRVVRHSLAHTTFNLYEGLLRFSDSFINNEINLDRYFIPQGEKDKRNDVLKEEAALRKNMKDPDDYGISDIYDALSCGDGQPVYLSDGIWITSSGEMYD